MSVTLKSKLIEAANRVWKAWMKWGPVDDGRPEGDEFDKALINLRVVAKRTKVQTDEERAALVNIINVSNEFPEPIHYKLREAINHARTVLNDSDMWAEVIEEKEKK